MIASALRRCLLLALCVAGLAIAAPVYYDVGIVIDPTYSSQAGWLYIQFAPGVFDLGNNPDFVSASASVTPLAGGDTSLLAGPLRFGNASGDLTGAGAVLGNGDPAPDSENAYYHPVTFGSNLSLRVALNIGPPGYNTETALAFGLLYGTDWNSAVPIQSGDDYPSMIGYLHIDGNGAITPDPRPSGYVEEQPLPSSLTFTKYNPEIIGQVPEPATYAGVAAGLAALALLKRRRR